MIDIIPSLKKGDSYAQAYAWLTSAGSCFTEAACLALAGLA